MSDEKMPVAILSWEQADQVMQDQQAEIARLRAELSGARQQGETGQPVLTDAEREAVDECVRCAYPATHHAAATLRGLLDRLGGGE